MARGDVRIAVTLACEDCKRRNYQTNKSKRNNPDRIQLRKYCRWCRRHTEPPGDPLARAIAGRRQPRRKRSDRQTASRTARTSRASSSTPRATSRRIVRGGAIVSGARRARPRSTTAELEEELAAAQAEADARGEPDEDSTTSRPSGRRPRAGRAPRPRQPTSQGRLPRLRLPPRLWAELQRVQWPDRRQVAQATAVVLGFVVIAGAYLGLADAVAQKVVDFIL